VDANWGKNTQIDLSANLNVTNDNGNVD
jgi:hypothetical protein